MDLIDRQAAIDALRTCYDTETITMDNGDEYINYGDAVGEIEQLPPIHPVNNSEMPNSSDAISRQAAIDALGEKPLAWEQGEYEDGLQTQWESDVEAIKALPSSEPKRIRAKWIATTALQEGQITWRDYKCSNCSHHRGKPMNFCEVCGAKMER